MKFFGKKHENEKIPNALIVFRYADGEKWPWGILFQIPTFWGVWRLFFGMLEYSIMVDSTFWTPERFKASRNCPDAIIDQRWEEQRAKKK